MSHTIVTTETSWRCSCGEKETRVQVPDEYEPETKAIIIDARAYAHTQRTMPPTERPPTECPEGHAMTEVNTVLDCFGVPECVTCKRSITIEHTTEGLE